MAYQRKVRPEPKKPHLVTDEDRQRAFVRGTYPRKCLQCGTGYNYHPAAKDKGHEHKRGLFCSWDCKSQHIKDSKPGPSSKLHLGICKTCSAPMATRSKRVYCSDACLPKVEYLPAPPVKKKCRCCGISFMSENTGGMRKQFCSDECRKEMGAEARRVVNARRKALLRSVTVERVDPFVVFDRDGWKCQICGIDTPREKRSTYANDAPELDHIMPIAKGGEHSYANTQCACRKCNIIKSDTVLPKISSSDEKMSKCCMGGIDSMQLFAP